MRHGARINVMYLNPERRKNNFKKCVVCEKALTSQNNSNLCSIHFQIEYMLNYNNQIIKDDRRQDNNFK